MPVNTAPGLVRSGEDGDEVERGGSFAAPAPSFLCILNAGIAYRVFGKLPRPVREPAPKRARPSGGDRTSSQAPGFLTTTTSFTPSEVSAFCSASFAIFQCRA